jgi:hypothetical protein
MILPNEKVDGCYFVAEQVNFKSKCAEDSLVSMPDSAKLGL